MYALTGADRGTATPKTRATCPTCQATVIAKCGQIISWHWAHESGLDCDPWAEPDNEWHRMWQGFAPPNHREVVMGPHRADIVTVDGTVIELQHSHISVEEITEREAFYGRMVWLFDATEAVASGRLSLRAQDYPPPVPGAMGGASFRWKQARKTVGYTQRPTLLDLGNGMLLWLKKLHLGEPPHGGWGWLIGEHSIRLWLGAA